MTRNKFNNWVISNSYSFCRNNARYILTALLFCIFSFASEAQFNIDVNKPANPLTKAGYNLIFSDDFNTFNSGTWDRSYPGNDGPNYGDNNFCSHVNVRNAPKNVINVLDPITMYDGVNEVTCLPLRTKEGEDKDACSYSSAEIKSFLNEVESPDYRDWKIYPNTYVEVRFKAPKCPGLGGGPWLYGPSQANYDEIDFMEMYGDHPGSFQTAMHWGPNDEFHDDGSGRVDLFDLDGNTIDIGDYFLSYGVYLDPAGRVDITVNDTWVSWKELYKNSCGKFDPLKRLQPYNLRISTGSTTLSGGDVTQCDDLPAYLYIDHVRVYQKAGTKAVKYHPNTTGKMNLCSSGSGKNFGITYYPGAIYTWSEHPGFNINNPDEEAEHKGDDNWRYYWVSTIPGVASGVYTLTLTITFPGGYTETLPLEVTVNSGAALPPGPIQVAVSPGEVSAFVTKQTGTMGYEWKVNNLPWKYVDNTVDPGAWNVCPVPLIAKPGQNSQNVCVRAVTGCAVSGFICQTITFPAPGDMSNPKRPATPNDVEVEQVSGCEYRLKVSQSEVASEYQWSYDAQEWNSISAQFGSAYNRFGSYLCGSDPFDIYVRAKSDNFLTDVYTKQINLPAGNGSCSGGRESTKDRNNANNPVQYGHGDVEIESVAVMNVIGQNVRISNKVSEPDHVILYGLQSGVYFLQYLGRDGVFVKARKVAFVASH